MPVSVQAIDIAIIYLNSLSMSLNTYCTTININTTRHDTNILCYRYYSQILKDQHPNANSDDY